MVVSRKPLSLPGVAHDLLPLNLLMQLSLSPTSADGQTRVTLIASGLLLLNTAWDAYGLPSGSFLSII